MNLEYAKEVIEYSESVMKQRELDEIEAYEYDKAIIVFNDSLFK
jgi:5S rRNA maturation endonuclease (ribonuclease M5)